MLKDTLKIWLPGYPKDAVAKLNAHAALVLRWGKSMNLTGAKDSQTLLAEHSKDAIPLASLPRSGSRLLDVGSGAGFPGIVLAILRPDLKITLLENNHKKAVFLRTVIRELGLQATAINGDVKATVEGAPFDEVVARAVFAPQQWLQLGAPLLIPGGALYALLAESEPPQEPSLSVERLCVYQLDSGASRTIAVYRKQA